MSLRITIFFALCIAIGAALALSELRWFRPIRIAERLAPYSPYSTYTRRRLRTASFKEVLTPLATSLGTSVSGLLGVEDELSVRLTRVHSPMDPTAFRMRQLGYAVVAAVIAAAVTLSLQTPPLLSTLLLLGAPSLAYLIPEQQLSTAGSNWRKELVLELPVVAEQLGMLLSAGFSLGSALIRLGERGQGRSGADIRRVCAQIRYGTSEIQALRDWADIVQVPALERLIAVLSLNQEATDLGRLISEEARAIRRDTQRDLIEAIERKAQLVWVPVTVAALVPGTLFLIVPFIEAMKLFTAN